IGGECKAAAQRNVPRVYIAPEVPAAQSRVLPEGGESIVILGFHDVREAQRDVRRAGPAVELSPQFLGKHLRERIARLRIWRMVFVDGRVSGLLTLERQTEDRLARRPHDT